VANPRKPKNDKGNTSKAPKTKVSQERSGPDSEQPVSNNDPSQLETALEAEPASPVKPKDIRRLLKHGRKLLKGNRKRLTPSQIAEVEGVLGELAEALTKTKTSPISDEDSAGVFHRADRVIDRHLGFAQKGALREYAESIILAILFALVLRAFVVEAFKIPTKSMVPTLLEGDHLFVNKFSYGIRIPFTTKRLISFGEPERGDVIVFVFPREQAAEHIAQHGRDCLDKASLTEEKDYIKRVIGLPGDTIEVINNVVHIDGEPVPRTVLYRHEVSDRSFPPHRRLELWSEETLNGQSYNTISREASVAGNFGPIKVKEDHVFVMGDNRDNSSDSRCWGQVPMDNIKGEALVIWWSNGPYGPRWSRMFTLVE